MYSRVKVNFYGIYQILLFFKEMGGKDISDRKIGAAAALLETEQYSYSAIARKLDIGRDSVRRIAQKMKAKENIFVSRRENCGRKPKTSNRVERKIVRIALENRHAPIKVITNTINERGVKISQRTVRRRLKEAKLMCRRPAKKPRLIPRMRQQRLLWGRQHQEFTEFDWNRVSLKYKKNKITLAVFKQKK